MSVQSEITRINGNIANAYTAVSGKGGTLPTARNSANLPAAIASITPAKPEQAKTLTLGAAAPSTVTPDSGKVLSSVPVVLDTSVIKAENIAKDVTMLGVTGTHEGGQSIPFFEIDAPTMYAEYGMFWYDHTINSSRHFSYSPELTLSQVLSSIDFSAKLRGINGSTEEYFNEFRIFGRQFGVRTDTLASTHKTTGFFVAEGDYIGEGDAPFRGHYDPSYLPDIYDANFMIGFSFGPSEDLWTIRGADGSDRGVISMDMEETEDGASLYFDAFNLCKNGIPRVSIQNLRIYFTQYFQDVSMKFEATYTESFDGDLVDFCVYITAD